jgi:hypothetical protein
VFEVHYGGRFDKTVECQYMGGEVVVHTESVESDELSHFELEAIYRPYGYKSGDLIFFLDPGESLANGLHLITSDHNVLFMVEQHKTHNIVHLYIVSFEEGIVDVFKEDDEDEDGARVGLNDPWWHDKISDEEDLFDVDVDDVSGGAKPSSVVPNRSEFVRKGNKIGMKEVRERVMKLMIRG